MQGKGYRKKAKDEEVFTPAIRQCRFGPVKTIFIPPSQQLRTGMCLCPPLLALLPLAPTFSSLSLWTCSIPTARRSCSCPTNFPSPLRPCSCQPVASRCPPGLSLCSLAVPRVVLCACLTPVPPSLACIFQTLVLLRYETLLLTSSPNQ